MITVEHVNTLGQQIKLATAKQLVQHARNDIERICDHLEARSRITCRKLCAVPSRN